MAQMEDAIIGLLQGKIQLEGRRIPVIIRNKPIDKTPCITVNQASHTQLSRTIFHDPYEKVRYNYQSEVWIDVWCDTEDEREYLVEQVYLLFHKAIANHFNTCDFYDDGMCSFFNDVCASLTVNNGRTAKSQCPNPEYYPYTSFFKKNNIFKNTFKIDGESEMDDTTIDPPVLRTNIKVNMQYYSDYRVGGLLADKLEVQL